MSQYLRNLAGRGAGLGLRIEARTDGFGRPEDALTANTSTGAIGLQAPAPAAAGERIFFSQASSSDVSVPAAHEKPFPPVGTPRPIPISRAGGATESGSAKRPAGEVLDAQPAAAPKPKPEPRPELATGQRQATASPARSDPTGIGLKTVVVAPAGNGIGNAELRPESRPSGPFDASRGPAPVTRLSVPTATIPLPRIAPDVSPGGQRETADTPRRTAPARKTEGSAKAEIPVRRQQGMDPLQPQPADPPMAPIGPSVASRNEIEAAVLSGNAKPPPAPRRVQVRIGRVEVRAVGGETKAPSAAPTRHRGGFAEYLSLRAYIYPEP